MRLTAGYSCIRSTFGEDDCTSTYDHYHYIDIDRIADDSGEQDQAVRLPGYEKLDQSDITAQNTQDYVALGHGKAAESTQVTTEDSEEVQMTGAEFQNTVSHCELAVLSQCLIYRTFDLRRSFWLMMRFSA